MTTGTQTQTINILLVEDDDVDVLNVKRAFKKNNITHPLYLAGNGIEALKMLRGDRDHPPEVPPHRRLILLDLNMPCMGGIEFLQTMRADPKLRSIPVVVLTTSEEERDRVQAQQLNAAGYLLKPVRFSEFVELVAVLNQYWTLSRII
jgi:CheY-like chemotaxis protein